jgi:hypothetical protein
LSWVFVTALVVQAIQGTTLEDCGLSRTSILKRALLWLFSGKFEANEFLLGEGAILLRS